MLVLCRAAVSAHNKVMLLSVTSLMVATVSVTGLEVLDLADLSWRVRGGDNQSVEVEATLPGSIYTDLQRGGILGDLYYRFNDVEYQWVSQYNWTYQTVLNLSVTQLEHEVVELDCHGLDTVASVTINGVVVANTNNMFMRSHLHLSSPQPVTRLSSGTSWT